MEISVYKDNVFIKGAGWSIETKQSNASIEIHARGERSDSEIEIYSIDSADLRKIGEAFLKAAELWE